MREFYNDIKKYLTPFNTSIIVLCILTYLVQKISADHISDLGASGWLELFEEREYYRAFTYMFLHSDFLHIFNNMLVLAFVGSTVEKLIGGWRYLICYLGCGVVAALASAAYNRSIFYNSLFESGGFVRSIGASGAIFGMVGALLWIVIANKGRVEQVSSRQLLMFIILSVYAGIMDNNVDNIAHFAGLLFGVISAIFLYDRRGGRNEG